jgi:protein gp37
MGEHTKISWCDSTVNFWSGCTRHGAGCEHCYAEALARRLPTIGRFGQWKPRKLHESAFRLARSLNRRPWICDTCADAHTVKPWACCGTSEFHRRRVFSLSLGDWLDDEVPDEWRAQMFNTVIDCSDVDWLLVTKRSRSWRLMLSRLLPCLETGSEDNYFTKIWLTSWLDGRPPKNVWVIQSISNQEDADREMPHLLRIPAAVRGLSIEPLLGPVDLSCWLGWKGEHEAKGLAQPLADSLRSLGDVPGADWVIVGGESGPAARPCDQEWIRGIVHQCRAAGVACFVKQMGANSCQSECDGVTRPRPMRDPKGADPAEWPADLRVREFPV